MKENSFKRNREGPLHSLIALHWFHRSSAPRSNGWRQCNFPYMQFSNRNKPSQVLSRMQQEKPLSVPAYWKKAHRTAQSLIWMVNSP